MEKDSKIPGGTVKSAYCLCVAGLVGTCNDVVAIRFGIEHAVRFNLTNPTSTSKLWTWNVPSSNKVDTPPKRIKELSFYKPQYMKEGNIKKHTAANKGKFLAFSQSW